MTLHLYLDHVKLAKPVKLNTVYTLYKVEIIKPRHVVQRVIIDDDVSTKRKLFLTITLPVEIARDFIPV
jgi:hypothetical protein